MKRKTVSFLMKTKQATRASWLARSALFSPEFCLALLSSGVVTGAVRNCYRASGERSNGLFDSQKSDSSFRKVAAMLDRTNHSAFRLDNRAEIRAKYCCSPQTCTKSRAVHVARKTRTTRHHACRHRHQEGKSPLSAGPPAALPVLLAGRRVMGLEHQGSFLDR